MKRVKRNLFLFFSILTFVAVLFTSCPHNEPPVPSLTIDGKETYYYKNGKWYADSECKTEQTVLTLSPASKTVVIEVDFGVDGATTTDVDDEFFKRGENTFTFAFDKYTEEGKDDDYFSENTPSLPKDGITSDVKLVSKYETKVEKRKLPALTISSGEKLEGYKLNNAGGIIDAGREISITAEAKGGVYVAWWPMVYSLTVDNAGRKEIVAYCKNGNWYSDEKYTTPLKNNKIGTPEVEEETYEATLKYNDGDPGTPNGKITTKKEFVGYFENGSDEIPKIGKDGSVEGYKITKDTTLVPKISARFSKPNPSPKREGYAFVEWKYNGDTYDFNKTEAINGITLDAEWAQIYTVSIDTRSNKQINPYYFVKGNLYSDKEGAENLDESKKVEKLATPDSKILRKVTFVANGGKIDGVDKKDVYTKDESTFEGYTLSGGTDIKVKVDGTFVNGYSITDTTNFVAKWSEVKLAEDSVSQLKLTAPGDKSFKKWVKGENGTDKDAEFDIINTSLTEDITLKAIWGYNQVSAENVNKWSSALSNLIEDSSRFGGSSPSETNVSRVARSEMSKDIIATITVSDVSSEETNAEETAEPGVSTDPEEPAEPTTKTKTLNVLYNKGSYLNMGTMTSEISGKYLDDNVPFTLKMTATDVSDPTKGTVKYTENGKEIPVDVSKLQGGGSSNPNPPETSEPSTSTELAEQDVQESTGPEPGSVEEKVMALQGGFTMNYDNESIETTYTGFSDNTIVGKAIYSSVKADGTTTAKYKSDEIKLTVEETDLTVRYDITVIITTNESMGQTKTVQGGSYMYVKNGSSTISEEFPLDKLGFTV